jgi:uncharacterized protein YjbI with pentapeptide repeats
MDSSFRTLKSLAASRSTKGLFTFVAAALASIICRTATAEGAVVANRPWWTSAGWLAGVGVLAAAAVAATALAIKRRGERRRQENALEQRFGDALARFSDEHDPKARANAADRLAEMARQRYPGRRARLSQESYPIFERAASRLATALCSEEEDEVRGAVVSCLGSMVEFGKGGDQALLRVQIRELARANRTCKEALQRDLGEYWSLRREANDDVDECLWPLLRCLPLCKHEAGTLACLRDLAGIQDCLEAAEAVPARRGAEAADDKVEDRVLERLKARAAHLRDCETALVDSLHALPGSGNLSSDSRPNNDRSPAPDAPDLHECCLAGADLEGCRLSGADLSHTELHGVGFRAAELAGAKLDDAHMQWANLEEALLRGARLENARLQSADLGHALLRKAHLRGAHFEGATLRRADLRDACLDGAHLGNADLIAAKLQGGSFVRANLEGAHLFKAVVEEDGDEGHRVAYFTGANWWDADFTHPRSGRLDRNLVKWLSERFPRPKDDAVTPYPSEH